MSWWRRGPDASRPHSDDAARGAGGELEITRFEYVPVGEMALARVAGRSDERVPPPSDAVLVVRSDGSDERVPALSGGAIELAGRWHVSFTVSLKTMTDRGAAFALEVDGAVIALPSPVKAARARSQAARAQRRFEREPSTPLNRLQEYLEEAERDRDAARAVVDAMRGELTQSRERIAALQRERDAEREHADELAAELQAARDRVAALDESLQERDQMWQERLAAAERELDLAREALRAALFEGLNADVDAMAGREQRAPR